MQSEGAGFQPKHHHLICLQFDSPEWTFYEDAVSDVRTLVEQLQTAEEMLEGFATTSPPHDPAQAKGVLTQPLRVCRQHAHLLGPTKEVLLTPPPPPQRGPHPPSNPLQCTCLSHRKQGPILFITLCCR